MMSAALRLISAHRHFIIIVPLLTLVMSYPTILYIFDSEVIWHPAGGNLDSNIEFWDAWYGSKVLAGQADRYYTNLMFYPEGVSLKYHPFFWPHVLLAWALGGFLTITNALSLGFTLVILSSAFSAYIYALWLFQDKWIALFGAVIFGFCPHIMGHAQGPYTGWLAPFPLVLYFFHRGMRENRRLLVIVSGLLTGLTTLIVFYAFVMLLMCLGFFSLAFAVSRWRDRRFWLSVLLLVSAIAVASVWRLAPLMDNTESTFDTMMWHGFSEYKADALALIVNYGNPVLGRPMADFFGIQSASRLSKTNYLGYLPLLLICLGLVTKATRRKMLPWALLFGIFLILRLGSHPNINGTVYFDIRLPKYYLDQILPVVFEAFWDVGHFMMGVMLSLIVLACFGLVALQKRFRVAASPAVVLTLCLIVAFEYYMPLRSKTVSDEQIAFLSWLGEESGADAARLINLPMGRENAKRYNLYQALSGFPQVEGAISRTPERAYGYIKGNFLLSAWYRRLPVHCDMVDEAAFLSGLEQLEKDGFSHIVIHRRLDNSRYIDESFHGLAPAYSDEYVSIFRMGTLRDACPGERKIRHRFTALFSEALSVSSILKAREGHVLVFPPSARANDHFLRHLRYYAPLDKHVLTIASDEPANISIESSRLIDLGTDIDLEQYTALWLVNDSLEFDAKDSALYQDWFLKRFNSCARLDGDERISIELYIRADIPCSALDESSAPEVRYDGGLLLRNVSYDLNGDHFRAFLAWQNNTEDKLSYSIQFFDDDGGQALHDDRVIRGQLLTVHDFDTSALAGGAYSVKLIVYDFETRISQGGTLTRTGGRFERELEIASIMLLR